MRKHRNHLVKYLRKNHLAISLFCISIGLALTLHHIRDLNSQHALLLAESYRRAESKSLEINIEGGKAYPLKSCDKWGVCVQEELGVKLSFQISSSVVFIKQN